MLGEMTNAYKRMNPLCFESDPADIRIRINPEIQIRIPDHFWFSFWPWRRFALSEHSLVTLVCHIYLDSYLLPALLKVIT